MSRSTQKGRAEAQAPDSHKRSSTEFSQTIREIDNTLIQLRERTIPQQPYLLSVPSDVPYRYFSSRFIDTWYEGTPFSGEEAQLQYLSFFPHQGEEDSLLKVVGGWADDKGNLVEEAEASPFPQSGQNTPNEQPNRKKISLQDYKTKDKTRPSTPTIKAPVEELRKQVMKSEAKETGIKIGDDRRIAKGSDRPVVKNETVDSSKTVKPQGDGSGLTKMKTEPQRDHLPSPRKRRRLSVDSAKREDAPVKLEKVREIEDTKGLPSLLSPTLPAQQKRGYKALPGLLLPDLPPALEKLLAKAEAKSKAENNSGPRTDQVKSVSNNALGPLAGKRPPEKAPSDSNVARVRSDSQTSTKQGVGTPKVLSPAIKSLLKTGPRPATPLQNGTVASPEPRQRHRVVLRYGKKNTKRVLALLKFTPHPKKTKVAPEEPASKPVEVRPTSAKSVPEPEKYEKVERKRPAEPSPERPAKKLKQLETPEKSRASTVSAAKSPAIAAATKSKPDLLTPKKEVKPSAVRPTESYDGTETRTPQIDRARTSTPINAASSSQSKISPGPASTISKEDRAGWQEINSKCFTLGRTLKHEGTSLAPSPVNGMNEKDQALSVVLLIEALLCFMINHAAQSQARPSVDPGWSTILPYHIFVFRASRKFRHLHGLVIQLGAICRQAIHNFDIDRLAREPLPFELYESAPTPGSDGNTRQNDDVDKHRKRYLSFRDQLVQNARELQSAWLEGSRYLSPTLIEREYPKTWVKRTKDTSKRGFEKPKPGAIGRDYYLPLDISSTAFEAARFSMSFLKEWSDKEKISWKPRIEF